WPKAGRNSIGHSSASGTSRRLGRPPGRFRSGNVAGVNQSEIIVINRDILGLFGTFGDKQQDGRGFRRGAPLRLVEGYRVCEAVIGGLVMLGVYCSKEARLTGLSLSHSVKRAAPPSGLLVLSNDCNTWTMGLAPGA